MSADNHAAPKPPTRKDVHASRDWGFLNHGGSAVGVDWGCADAEDLRAAVQALTRGGVAVTLAATRNNRAVRITLHDGDQHPIAYANDPEELADLLNSLILKAQAT